MDHLANELDMDPIELRTKNFLKDGDNLVRNQDW
jgi:CO/xanthine dehydrogenase Mo-binding subunit